MNLFLLSWIVEECARWHFDRHMKMIVELAQLLCTAHWVLDCTEEKKEQLDCWLRESRIYRPTHRNHPCARWVREHVNNYRFTCLLAKALGNEYYHRYGKEKNRRHATEAMIDFLILHEPRGFLPFEGSLVGPHSVTEPAQAMPDEFKVPGDAISAYRAYYCSPEKSHLTAWRLRDKPDWFVFSPVVKNLKKKVANDGSGDPKSNKKRRL